MSMIVIMPGGFHPFHAGHFALYQSAKQAFPNAEVYVAATNDMSERPFPFALKEKLAKLAGVEPGHFVQVKNPFQSKEITQNYNPDQDVLVFVRSEKDRNEQPKPGGTKKDGSPAYFQPWTGKNVQPFGKHAYMAYLPTVEFGPGITSATQIRKAWPTLNDKRKTALVMSLYPAAQKNPKLAQNVVGMFDQVMGGQQVNEFAPDDSGDSGQEDIFFKYAKMWYNGNLKVQQRVEEILAQAGWEIGPLESEEGGAFIVQSGDEDGDTYMGWSQEELKGLTESALKDKSDLDAKRKALQDMEREPGHDKEAIRQRKLDLEKEARSKGLSEEKDDLFIQADPESEKLLRFAQQHYPTAPSKQQAFIKFVQRALMHSEEDDKEQDKEIAQIKSELNQIQQDHEKIMRLAENSDYLEEK